MAPGTVDARSTLAAADLFSALEPDLLQVLADRAEARTWPAGALVLEQGAPGGSLVVLRSGACTVYRRPGQRDRAALVHLRAPAVLGEVTLLDGSPRTATVEATEDADGVELRREDLLVVLRQSPALLDALLVQLGTLVRRLSDQAAEHVLLDLGGRVARTLVALAGETGHVHLTQSRIAELAGGSRQSLNIVLRTFARRGLVQVDGRAVVVLDRDGLRRRAGLAAGGSP
jgi:CRP/FNR family cyclic AMP-dependent transcriptional regulator